MTKSQYVKTHMIILIPNRIGQKVSVIMVKKDTNLHKKWILMKIYRDSITSKLTIRGKTH